MVAATPPRSPLGRPDTRCPFLSIYPLSLPLPCPVPGSPGGGALGAAGGAAGGSGAALAHAPGPGAVQLPRPQLALLRARPCTSLLNRLGGRGPRWEAPPLVDSTRCRPGPSAPLSVSVLAVEATPVRPFAHTRSLQAEAPCPDLATYLSEDPSIKVSGLPPSSPLAASLTHPSGLAPLLFPSALDLRFLPPSPLEYSGLAVTHPSPCQVSQHPSREISVLYSPRTRLLHPTWGLARRSRPWTPRYCSRRRPAPVSRTLSGGSPTPVRSSRPVAVPGLGLGFPGSGSL